MSAELIAVLAVIVVALAFDYTNGFHDAANAIATSVSTRALTPGVALLMAAIGNFVGAHFGAKVAKTVGSGLVSLPTGMASLGDRLRRRARRDLLEPDHLVLRPAVVVVARAVRRPGRRDDRGRPARCSGAASSRRSSSR